MRRALTVSVLLIVAAAALVRVLAPPPSAGHPPSRPEASRPPGSSHGAGARPPAGQPADGATPGPVAVITAFAERYINWNAGDVAAVLRGLAARSVGQARSAMILAAAQTGADPALRQGGVANAGTVESVGPIAGRPATYAVVTLETTSAADDPAYAGLPAAWHVTVATVTRVGGRWTVSAWQPES